MNAVELVLPRLCTEEGFRSHAYHDSVGRLTWGYGQNIDAGVSPFVAKAALIAQCDELNEQLMTYTWYAALDPARQSVCLDIAFNGGLHDLLNYPHMIAALSKSDWEKAASECTVSNPKLQGRYQQLAQIILTGQA